MNDTNEIINRVRALMLDEGIDTEDETLVLKISIIYVQAQKDELESKLQENKQ